MKPKPSLPAGLVSVLRQTVNEWLEDGALRLSAALAYYSIFSIAPLLIIVISIAGLVFGEEAVRGKLDDELRSYIGTQAATGVQSMVQGAAKPSQGWISAVTGFGALLFGASGVFGQLKDALNTIWEVKVTKAGGIIGFLRERLLTFGMVLVIGFLLLTSLLLSAGIAAMSAYFNTLLGVPPEIWTAVTLVTSAALITVLFAVIFKVLPDADVHWKDVWIGAAATAVLFELGKFGLGLYLGRESMASTYGAAGSVVLLLLWVYYASCILLFGAEFTQVYAKAAGRVVAPAENAVPVTDEARAQQGMDRAEPAEVPVETGTKQVKNVEIAARETGKALTPATLFMGTTALSFLTGLLVRRRFFHGKS